MDHHLRGFGRITSNREMRVSPKRVNGIFYRQGNQGFSKGRKEKINLK
jgi:hypothetical protein